VLDLTWWQIFALVGSLAISVTGGRLLGAKLHRALSVVTPIAANE
jgi:hypothetical protein